MSSSGWRLPTAHPIKWGGPSFLGGDHELGQYISVAVTLADGTRQIRQYSLTGALNQQEWAVTVKAIAETPAGEVSNFLHHNVFEHDLLTVSPPFGNLVLRDDPGPLLLISAGIGSTPIIGMLHHLVATDTDRHVTVLHADRSPSRHAHRQELSDLVDQLPGSRLHHWYEDLGVRLPADTTAKGRIDLGSVDIDPDSQVYLCGPAAVHGVGPDRAHRPWRVRISYPLRALRPRHLARR